MIGFLLLCAAACLVSWIVISHAQATAATAAATAAGTTPTVTKPWWQEKAVQQTVVAIVLCHFGMWYFFRSLYEFLFWEPSFWVDHVLLAITFTFLTKKAGKRKLVITFGRVLVTIIFLGNIKEMIEVYKAKELSKAHALMSEWTEEKPFTAPVGDWSAPFDFIPWHACQAIRDDRVYAKYDDDEPIMLERNEYPTLRASKVRYASATKTPVNVVMRCK